MLIEGLRNQPCAGPSTQAKTFWIFSRKRISFTLATHIYRRRIVAGLLKPGASDPLLCFEFATLRESSMRVCTVVLLLAWALLPTVSVLGGFVVNIVETGPDVVITFSGSANTSGLAAPGDGVSSPALRTTGWGFGTSTTNVPTSRFAGIVNPPTYFYTGTLSLTPNSGSGDRLGLLPTLNILVLPRNYVSGTQLSGTSTFTNATLQSLNMTPGVYTTTWGSGANADSLIMNVGVTAVPEPSSLVLLSVGAVGLFARRLRRRTSTATDSDCPC